MKRPVVIIAPAVATGILTATYLPYLSWVTTGVILLLLCAGIWRWNGNRLLICLLLAGLLMGVYRQQLTISAFNHPVPDPSIWEADTLHLEGKVVKSQRISGYLTRYQMNIQQVTVEEKNYSVTLPIMLEVRDYNGLTTPLYPGSNVVITDYRIRHDLTQSTETPYLNQLKSQGYRAVLHAFPEGLQVNDSQTPRIQWIRQGREYSERVIDGYIREPENQVLKSLFFGHQGMMAPDLRDRFAQTGTAHLVAVSGLHVAILAMAAQIALGKTGFSKQTVRIMTVMLVWLYAAMAGFSISILRAGTMYSLYVLSFLLKRRYDAKSILLWTGLIFVWIRPSSIHSVSFQLSFIAALSIIWLVPAGKSLTAAWIFPGKEMLLVTLAAQLGTFPIVAAHFGNISLGSVPANIMILPVLGILMPLGLFMVLLHLASGFIATLPALVVRGGLHYILWVLSIFESLEGFSLTFDSFHPAWITGYYTILLGIYGKMTCRQKSILNRH